VRPVFRDPWSRTFSVSGYGAHGFSDIRCRVQITDWGYTDSRTRIRGREFNVIHDSRIARLRASHSLGRDLTIFERLAVLAERGETMPQDIDEEVIDDDRDVPEAEGDDEALTNDDEEVPTDES